MVIVIVIKPLEHFPGFGFLGLSQRVAVDPFKHKLPQVIQGFFHLGGEFDFSGFTGGGDHIAHQGVDSRRMGLTQNVQHKGRNVIML